jgi:hypothetical protein
MTIGYTECSAQDIRKIVEQLGQEFTGNSYHLFRRSCNHFTNAFIRVRKKVLSSFETIGFQTKS